jgi:hypothetical protein
MSKVKVNKVILDARNEEHNILTHQFFWRTRKKFIGDSEIVIMNNKEAVWWNRPLTSDVFCKEEEDGLYSYNLPFLDAIAGGTAIYKTGYNLILNENSIPCAAHIQLDATWSDEQKRALEQMFYYCIHKTLIELGVSKEDLSMSRNDITYKGKKFVCGEHALIDDVYTEDLVITLQVLPEKEIFDRLTGKYAHKIQITGIAEEVPSITKEKFIDSLYKNVQEYVNANFN